MCCNKTKRPIHVITITTRNGYQVNRLSTKITDYITHITYKKVNMIYFVLGYGAPFDKEGRYLGLLYTQLEKS